MSEPSQASPQIFNHEPQRFEYAHHVKVEGSVHVHVHLHFDDSATLAKLTAELKAKTDEAKTAVDEVSRSTKPT